MITTTPSWKRLGSVRPTDLAAARLELHWALQIPAALGIARGAPAADFAHHALAFDAEQGSFLSALVPGKRSYRAALRASETRIELLDANHSVVAALPLAGRKLDEALAWLDEAAERYTGVPAAPLRRPEHELPPHRVAGGGRFTGADPGHALELARWFADVQQVLAPLADAHGAPAPRVWSHHFDLDVLVDRGERRLGLGFSPGDDGFAEPYLYGLPDPAPAADALPPLDAPAEWTTDGWTGAVLLGSRVAALRPGEQVALVEGFYRTLLGALA